MTQIYFLLGRGQFSRLHRIASDELWHFYQGSPLLVIEADPETGAVKETTLGGEDGVPFHVVPGGTWFGSRSLGEWSFVGCTVGPGFDYRDFEMPDTEGALLSLGSLVEHPSVQAILPPSSSKEP
jgi:uncharacterized protein